MNYILTKQISKIKPLVFLCGPFYDEKPHDRRRILKDYFVTDLSKKVIPVIVDIFLGKDRVKDESINIPLMEEICAAVSAKTYIFLDTFSAVAELGIFSSASHENKICVILPYDNDKLINNLNFFVSEVYKSSEHIDYISYRPRIARVPIASDFVAEYYEFPHNILPENIKYYIEQDPIFDSKIINLEINHKSNIPNHFHIINYTVSQKEYTVHLNLRTLFYIVASIYTIEQNENVEHILASVRKTLINTIEFYKNIDSISSLKINTGVRFDEEAIVKHIVKFIKLFNEFGQTTGELLLTKESALIKTETPFSYFRLTDEDIEVMKNYVGNQDIFVDQYNMKKNNKVRKIIKYKNSSEGDSLRRLHDKLVNRILEKYTYSDTSFAYRKGYSVLDCVKVHKDNYSFYFMDISKFFNSIHYGLLYRIFKNEVGSNFISNKELSILVKCLMYKNQVPLGFTTSPLISDMYLHNFDKNISNKMQNVDPYIVFTRYADDIIFSSPVYVSNDTKCKIEEIVTEEMRKLHLELNREKIRSQDLVNTGDHVKILGLNVVRNQSNNSITVGKKYINETAKMFLNYLSDVKNNTIIGEDKFYTEKKILGRVAYIKQIEGQKGFKLLINRINYSTDGRVIIEDSLIKLN